MRVDDAAHAHPAARDLLDDEGIGEERLAEAAELLGDHEPEYAELLEAVDDGLRVLVAVLELGRDREDLLVDERADGVQDLGLDVGESFCLGELRHRHASGAVSGPFLAEGK
ncbi:unannotated protein [freshwater metagenome]|uniref:Unannotated protein n=1 Tax=freshwater metagenome TaxID=449393 RepID=A0A6J6SMR5_9ZZZZ